MTALELLGGYLAGGFLMLVGRLCPESTGWVLPCSSSCVSVQP